MKEIDNINRFQPGKWDADEWMIVVETTDKVRYVFKFLHNSFGDDELIFSHRHYIDKEETHTPKNFRLPQNVETHMIKEYGEIEYREDFMVESARKNQKDFSND